MKITLSFINDKFKGYDVIEDLINRIEILNKKIWDTQDFQSDFSEVVDKISYEYRKQIFEILSNNNGFFYIHKEPDDDKTKLNANKIQDKRSKM